MTDRLALFGGPKTVTLAQDYRWPVLGQAEIDAVVGLMREGRISIGDGSGPIGDLEAAFARYTGARYALMHNSGTAALHAAYYGVGVGPGDEVLVPSYTWHATAGAVVAANGVPVFCESDPRTLNLDVDDAARRITPRTKAIAVVHMWGNVADLDAVMDLARARGLAVVEDCSHAHGATWCAKHVGTIGDVGAFSLQGSKVLVAGEGGMLITNDPTIFDRALVLGSHGRIQYHAHDDTVRELTTGLGFKYRPHPLGAAIALEQFRSLDVWNAGRRDNYDYLMTGLADLPALKITQTHAGAVRGGYYGTRLLYDHAKLVGISRGALLKALRAEGVEVDVERYPLLHLTPYYRNRQRAYDGYLAPTARPDFDATPYESGDLPATECFHQQLLALPVYTTPQFPLLDQIIEAFHKVMSGTSVEELKDAEERGDPVLFE
ncbi:MAG: DegT/DnrJ/EryC1/StrS family aminotransferase [Anaerolineae bacterium]|jgi:dTDP-4-amino-4,6-dideoxygalactose transaminase|nr:DegT/DnrJ/EryC1/StrS family aminotransferase [Anaerolineae bacterium]